MPCRRRLILSSILLIFNNNDESNVRVAGWAGCGHMFTNQPLLSFVTNWEADNFRGCDVDIRDMTTNSDIYVTIS